MTNIKEIITRKLREINKKYDIIIYWLYNNMYADPETYPLHRQKPNGDFMYPNVVKYTRKTDGWGRERINYGAQYSVPCISFGAERTVDIAQGTDIWGTRSDVYPRLYRYGLNQHLLQNDNLIRIGVGGFAPNGSIHLGHLQHVQALKDSNIPLMVASFNDIEAREVRGASDEEVLAAISSFDIVLQGQAQIELRTKTPELMELFGYFSQVVTLEDELTIFGRDLNKAEADSVNLQAAAYLWRSVEDNRVIPVGYDGIEELKRMAYINYLAQTKLDLPGGVFFISPQIHGWDANLKMGKSNPSGSLMVGDSLEETLQRIDEAEDSSSTRHMLMMISFLTSPRRDVLLDNKKIDFKELVLSAKQNLVENHERVFPLT